MQKKYFNIIDSTKVFVYCPAGIVTGGAELLHQLVDAINRNGGNAFVVYYGEKKHEIPDDYKKYAVQIADIVDDNKNNIVVIYEGYFKKLFELENAQVLLWWLSVDNFFYCQTANLSVIDLIGFNFGLGIKQLIKRIIKCILLKKKYSQLEL